MNLGDMQSVIREQATEESLDILLRRFWGNESARKQRRTFLIHRHGDIQSVMQFIVRLMEEDGAPLHLSDDEIRFTCTSQAIRHDANAIIEMIKLLMELGIVKKRAWNFVLKNPTSMHIADVADLHARLMAAIGVAPNTIYARSVQKLFQNGTRILAHPPNRIHQIRTDIEERSGGDPGCMPERYKKPSPGRPSKKKKAA